MKTKECTIPGCTNPYQARGWCSSHYGLWTRHGDPLAEPMGNDDRFWSKVSKTDDCWEWMGDGHAHQYGRFYANGRRYAAHRYSWELTNGPIPDGLVIDHKCWNKRCVKPAHLRLTTRSKNVAYQSKIQSSNTSGVRGVSWNKGRNAWVACVTSKGKGHYKYFGPDELDAAAAWVKAKREELFGEFAGVA